jgi:hypothetical protein
MRYITRNIHNQKLKTVESESKKDFFMMNDVSLPHQKMLVSSDQESWTDELDSHS